MKEILFVTGNAHKVDEANRILHEYSIHLEMARFEKVEIQADSLDEVAMYAAKTASSRLSLPFIVEDSGLFVSTLKGFPGPYSSFVYKRIGCDGILRLMEGKTDRSAHFECAVAYASTGTTPLLFRGVSEGIISMVAKGISGFGFDPIFINDASGGRTFAELPAHEKDLLSHRGMAFRVFGQWFTDTNI